MTSLWISFQKTPSRKWVVSIEYKRFEGESDEELIYRITGEKEKIGSWQDVADILNRLLGTEYTESKFRKQRQAFDRMFASVKAAESDYAMEIQNKLRELARVSLPIKCLNSSGDISPSPLNRVISGLGLSSLMAFTRSSSL